MNFLAVIHNGAHRGDDRRRAAQAALGKFTDLRQLHGALLHLHAEIILRHLYQAAPGDRGKYGAGLGGDQLAVLGNEDQVGAAGLLDVGAGGGVHVDVFVTLLFLFKTYRKPTVILLMLPLIFIGIVLGLLVLGKSFDFFSILGLLGLIGMNIKNAIVLVDQIDLETAAGKKPLDAVISATTSRIIPVAMASGTTILGMLPLLFDAMFGGMAATIMGGLLVASALTLFVLPVAYCAIHRIKGEQ